MKNSNSLKGDKTNTLSVVEATQNNEVLEGLLKVQDIFNGGVNQLDDPIDITKPGVVLSLLVIYKACADFFESSELSGITDALMQGLEYTAANKDFGTDGHGFSNMFFDYRMLIGMLADVSKQCERIKSKSKPLPNTK